MDQVETRQLALVPPQIVTMGQLPELLYDTPRPLAPALTQQLAWVAALRHTERHIVAPLTSSLPADHDLFAWLAFGERLATLHYELAGEGLAFAAVVSRGQSLATFREGERWQALAALQSRYLEVLEAAAHSAAILKNFSSILQGRHSIVADVWRSSRRCTRPPLLQISTLDSFFVQIARGLAPELGLPIDWQIVEEFDDQRLRLKRCRRCLLTALWPSWSTAAPAEQRRGSSTVVAVLDDTPPNPISSLSRPTRRPGLPPLYAAAEPGAVAEASQQITTLNFRMRASQRHSTAISRLPAARIGQLYDPGLAGRITAGEYTYYRTPLSRLLSTPSIRSSTTHTLCRSGK